MQIPHLIVYFNVSRTCGKSKPIFFFYFGLTPRVCVRIEDIIVILGEIKLMFALHCMMWSGCVYTFVYFVYTCTNVFIKIWYIFHKYLRIYLHYGHRAKIIKIYTKTGTCMRTMGNSILYALIILTISLDIEKSWTVRRLYSIACSIPIL